MTGDDTIEMAKRLGVLDKHSDVSTTIDTWDKVAADEDVRENTAQKIANAWQIERARCLEVVEVEISRGVARSIPQTSATMVILHRIAAAIRDGG